MKDRTTRLYISNIPWACTNADLLELFSPFGAVFWGRVILDEDGRSRGFGFVQMRSREEALKAIQALNGADLNGRKLIVNEAKQSWKGRGDG